MRLHRFFIEQKIPQSGEITIRDERLLHQWRSVFRMKTGDNVIFFDNSGYDYAVRFSTLGKTEAVCDIQSKIKNDTTPNREVMLYQSLVKKDNFEWIVEKCTELGVSEFVPILSERSEKKDVNMKRLEIISKEATEQSGRAKLPKLHGPITLESALKDITGDGIVLDPSGSLFLSLAKSYELKAISYFVGPEGGWSERELALFRAKEIPVYSLGTATLRAETAAIAVATLLLLAV